jgi:hypothetical protein
MIKSLRAASAVVFLAMSVSSGQAATLVLSASGSNAASIQAAVDDFRASLGVLNSNLAGSFGSGRREINWDGVPNALAAPADLPGDFFNTVSPRGVEFTTPGTGFQVSGNAGVVAVEFGNLDPSYPGLFASFTAQRLFTALGSNIVDVHFYVPGSDMPALTDGFGAVFTDVDLAATTSIEFFDRFEVSLGTFFALVGTGDETFSFLGVQFSEGPVIARARITSGDQVLAAGNTATDLVVMDDFIYGEPSPVPEPAAGAQMVVAVLIVWGLRRRSGD